MEILFLFLQFHYYVVASEEVEYYRSIVTHHPHSSQNNLHKKPRVFNGFSKLNYDGIVRKIYEAERTNDTTRAIKKRLADPVFHGHPKTREELWHEHFLNQSTVFDQNPSLIKLIHNITLTYLNDCTPIILYDSQIKSHDSQLFQDLFQSFPVTFIHGYIDDKDTIEEPRLLQPKLDCLHFILFLTDVQKSAKILGKQSKNKVIVVARSSQWAVQEFLAGSASRSFVNLLVIGQSFKDDDNVVRRNNNDILQC